jgi:hypothetical protein
MINIPDTIMTTDGYTPHKFVNGFVEHWENLRTRWPSESLFKKEGHQEPRKHGQRQHIRLFFCYTPWEGSKFFDQYMVDRKQLPEIWNHFVEELLYSKEYSEWIKETLQIPGNNFKYRLDFHITKGGRDVSPHVDTPGKIGSHLMYFMPDGWDDSCGGQTVFYKNKLVEQMNPEPKDFSHQQQYRNDGNTSLLFKNTENGWHGVTEVTSKLNRQILNLVILKKDS